MPIQVEIEGKGIVAEFPDGMSEEAIDAVVQRDFFSKASAAPDTFPSSFSTAQKASTDRGVNKIPEAVAKEALSISRGKTPEEAEVARRELYFSTQEGVPNRPSVPAASVSASTEEDEAVNFFLQKIRKGGKLEDLAASKNALLKAYPRIGETLKQRMAEEYRATAPQRTAATKEKLDREKTQPGSDLIETLTNFDLDATEAIKEFIAEWKAGNFVTGESLIAAKNSILQKYPNAATALGVMIKQTAKELTAGMRR